MDNTVTGKVSFAGSNLTIACVIITVKTSHMDANMILVTGNCSIFHALLVS